jgi:AraC-like DNA-binding protein
MKNPSRAAQARRHAPPYPATGKPVVSNYIGENVTRLGDETLHRGLCSPGVDATREPWCSVLSSCPVLADFGIRHMGIVEASADYCFERVTPRQSILLASLRGAGYAGTAPTLSLLPAGHGVMLPKGCQSSYFNASKNPWHLVWICFEHSESFVSRVDTGSFPLDPVVFHHALEMLITCWKGYGNATVSYRLLEGVMDLVKSHLKMRPDLEHFHKAWQSVMTDLGKNWDVARLAVLGGCSQERFRRLCWSEFGSSPMKHLTRLRLSRAKIVLSSSVLTIDEVSGMVGYSDAYAFSHAFKKSFGVSPRTFRKHEAPI